MEFLKTHKRPVIIAAAAVAVIALALFFLLRSGGGSAGAVYVQSVREITGGGLTLVERFSGVAESFLASLISRQEGEMSAESVIPAMRAVFAALESSRTGRFIDIPENRS